MQQNLALKYAIWSLSAFDYLSLKDFVPMPLYHNLALKCAILSLSAFDRTEGLCADAARGGGELRGVRDPD